MSGPVSDSYQGPPEDGPYVPSWCYGDGPKMCPCGHHEGLSQRCRTVHPCVSLRLYGAASRLPHALVIPPSAIGSVVRPPQNAGLGSSLESIMPMAVNSVHSAAIKGRPSGRPALF